MSAPRILTASWPVAWTPGDFEQRFSYNAGGLVVWSLAAGMSGRVRLRFGDNPDPDTGDPEFLVREGDVFTHASRYVWVVVDQVPGLPDADFWPRDRKPFVVLAVASDPCYLPTRGPLADDPLHLTSAELAVTGSGNVPIGQLGADACEVGFFAADIDGAAADKGRFYLGVGGDYPKRLALTVTGARPDSFTLNPPALVEHTVAGTQPTIEVDYVGGAATVHAVVGWRPRRGA